MAIVYTIGTWLKGKVDFNLTDSTLMACTVDHGITPNTPYAECSERVRDLSLAEVYIFLATSSQTSTGEYEADGGWQHRASAKNVVNRNWYWAEATRLRQKWGLATPNSGKVVIKDIY